MQKRQETAFIFDMLTSLLRVKPGKCEYVYWDTVEVKLLKFDVETRYLSLIHI